MILLFPNYFKRCCGTLTSQTFVSNFFSLDCLALEEELEPQTHITRLCACFEPIKFLPPTFPTVNAGLVADAWQWRVDAVLAFVRILRSWKSCPRNLFVSDLEVFCHRREVNWTEFEDLEQRAANFYCQMFFNYFGRAPSIPRRVFSSQ